ncbi:MAG: DUF2877 domain-containing protein [Betaproteobacteria bacterium]
MAKPERRSSRVEWGYAARHALSPGRRGKVIARFERSFYVATGGGLACVGGPGLGRGPLNVLVPGIKELPGLGETVRCTRGSIQFASGLTYPIQGAVLWRPVPAPAFRRGTLPRIPRIFPMESDALAAWMSDDARGKAPDAAARLIGLGNGLTPAGDDLIGGALIALRALGKSGIAGRLGKWALRLARARTNRISQAHLACAASGEGHEALHYALHAILAGHKNLGKELSALKRIGHTSGMDALNGVLLALDVTDRLHPVPR